MVKKLFPKYAILDGKKVVPVDSLELWAKFFEGHNRQIKKDKVGRVQVSTVFLGLDHSWGHGPSLWFETMIFGGEHDEFCKRYASYAEAEVGHEQALEMVKGPKDGE